MIRVRESNKQEADFYNGAKRTDISRDGLLVFTISTFGRDPKIVERELQEKKGELGVAGSIVTLGRSKWMLAGFDCVSCWVRMTEPRGSDAPILIKLIHPATHILHDS